MLDARHRAGEIGEQEYKTALSEFDRRYDEMLDRMDGTYQDPEYIYFHPLSKITLQQP